MASVTLLVILIFLTGCFNQEIICNKPYILVGDKCCLDANDNKICDQDETQEIKQTQRNKQNLEKLKENIDTTESKNVYDAVQSVFEKDCYHYETVFSDRVTEEKDWRMVGIKCNVVDDCHDGIKSVMKNSGLSGFEIEKELQDVINQGIKCE